MKDAYQAKVKIGVKMKSKGPGSSAPTPACIWVKQLRAKINAVHCY